MNSSSSRRKRNKQPIEKLVGSEILTQLRKCGARVCSMLSRERTAKVKGKRGGRGKTMICEHATGLLGCAKAGFSEASALLQLG